jgi:hypothetical protein
MISRPTTSPDRNRLTKKRHPVPEWYRWANRYHDTLLRRHAGFVTQYRNGSEGDFRTLVPNISRDLTAMGVRGRRELTLALKAKDSNWCDRIISGYAAFQRQYSDQLQSIQAPLEGERISHYPTLQDVLGNFKFLVDTYQVEFPRWRNDDESIKVITDPITLRCPSSGNEVALGRFAIKLPRSAWTTTRFDDFIVEALEPNLSGDEDGSDDDDEGTPRGFFHPHVNTDGNVCTGAQGPAIRAALREGRLGDAFDLFALILNHYNIDSPYCRLSVWNGNHFTCTDCGGRARAGHARGPSQCYRCDYTENGNRWREGDAIRNRLCRRCAPTCGGCGQRYCLKCAEENPRTHQRYCPSCRATCELCGEVGNRADLMSCVTSQDGMVADQRACPACRATCHGCGRAAVTDSLDSSRRCAICSVENIVSTEEIPNGTQEEEQHPTQNAEEVAPDLGGRDAGEDRGDPGQTQRGSEDRDSSDDPASDLVSDTSVVDSIIDRIHDEDEIEDDLIEDDPVEDPGTQESERHRRLQEAQRVQPRDQNGRFLSYSDSVEDRLEEARRVQPRDTSGRFLSYAPTQTDGN